MPYGQSPWEDASESIGGLGNSMSRLALMQQQGDMRRQQMMQQAAMQAAYLQLAREKQAADAQRFALEGPNILAQTGQYQSGAAKNVEETSALRQSETMADLVERLYASRGALQNPMLMQNPQALGDAVTALREANVFPKGEVTMPGSNLRVLTAALQPMFSRAIQAVLARQAATSPAAAGQMLRPMEVGAGQTLLDPITMKRLYQAPQAPMTPYQTSEVKSREEARRIAEARLRLDALRTAALVAAARGRGRPSAFEGIDPLEALALGGIGEEDQNGLINEGTGANVMTATNPKTGQRIRSTDGGQTWEPIP